MQRAKNSKGNTEENQRQRTCATSFKSYHGVRIIKITGTGQGQTNGTEHDEKQAYTYTAACVTKVKL